MVRVEVRDENVSDVLWLQVESRELIHDQILFPQMDGCHPTVQALREFLRLVEEAIGVAGVEKHRAELRMTKKREHGGEVNGLPASAVNGDVFGCSAVTGMKDVNLHTRLPSFHHFRKRVTPSSTETFG